MDCYEQRMKTVHGKAIVKCALKGGCYGENGVVFNGVLYN